MSIRRIASSKWNVRSGKVFVKSLPFNAISIVKARGGVAPSIAAGARFARVMFIHMDELGAVHCMQLVLT